jgi:hypothetical protein
MIIQLRPAKQYTEHTQKNGAVSLYSPLKPHHSFVLCPVYIATTLRRIKRLRGSVDQEKHEQPIAISINAVVLSMHYKKNKLFTVFSHYHLSFLNTYTNWVSFKIIIDIMCLVNEQTTYALSMRDALLSCAVSNSEYTGCRQSQLTLDVIR